MARLRTGPRSLPRTGTATLPTRTVVADRARVTRAVAKEHGALAKQIKPYLEYKQVLHDLKQAEELAAAESDPEMQQLARRRSPS